MESRAAWSAAGGALVVVAGTNAVAWAAAASARDSRLPSWPAVAFGVIAVAAFYVAIAALLRTWPFASLQSAPEVLDDRIRMGQETRERIVRLGLSDDAARVEYVRWFAQTHALLQRFVPALADEFMLASGDDNRFSGQALLIQHMERANGRVEAGATGALGAATLYVLDPAP